MIWRDYKSEEAAPRTSELGTTTVVASAALGPWTVRGGSWRQMAEEETGHGSEYAASDVTRLCEWCRPASVTPSKCASGRILMRRATRAGGERDAGAAGGDRCVQRLWQAGMLKAGGLLEYVGRDSVAGWSHGPEGQASPGGRSPPVQLMQVQAQCSNW